jgi:hypothetical protein
MRSRSDSDGVRHAGHLRGMNLAVWEEFRIFYRALVQALKDETSWPSPEVPAGKLYATQLYSPQWSGFKFAEIAYEAKKLPTGDPSQPLRLGKCGTSLGVDEPD